MRIASERFRVPLCIWVFEFWAQGLNVDLHGALVCFLRQNVPSHYARLELQLQGSQSEDILGNRDQEL